MCKINCSYTKIEFINGKKHIIIPTKMRNNKYIRWLVMLLNIFMGLIVPWIFGISLYNKNKRIIYTIAPIASVISFTVITLELDIGFWKLEPLNFSILPAIPFCVYTQYMLVI